jgi:phage tail sheath protein FI
MPFQLSPGVAVVEKDFTSIVPAVATSIGAFAGSFGWGPVMEPTTVSSENELVRRFGKPNDSNADSFFTAANFLSYTNNLLLVRADATGLKNAVSSGTAIKIKNTETYLASYASGQGTVGEWAAKYPGTLGNSLQVSMCDADSFSTWAFKDYFDATPGTSTYASSNNFAIANDELHIIVIDQDGLLTGTVGTVLEKFAFVSKASDAKKSDGTNNYYKDVVNSRSQYIYWMDATTSVATGGNTWGTSFASLNPNATLSGVAIAGTAGTFTCTAAALAVGDKITITGTLAGTGSITGYATGTVYKVSAVTGTSPSVTGFTLTTSAGAAIVTTAGTPTGLTYTNTPYFKSIAGAVTSSLTGGVDDFAPTDSDKQNAFALFANAELYDVSLVMLGKASAATATYVINNIAETRLDCVAFVSPQDTSSGDVIIGSDSTASTAITTYRDALPSSSYAVMDSGYKYQYDRYNDKYRYIPLNGDVAGLCARTDYTNDPWFSPGGLNRGQIKNVVKLAFNPNKTLRDVLYKKGVNPVVTFPGEGTVLFGDKTLLAKPSAFDRINVRRLFIVMEKAIATAAKFQLFEFNDGFTRAQFKNLVEPFLRDVQGRRGITDFVVKCDESNNTGEVIDRNEFVADIFVKPNRSINFITLNFVAARSAINFSEIGA